jgi:hypothetical protein
MDLGLDIFRTSGRAAQQPMAEVVRELGLADIHLLGTDRGVKAPALKRLSQRHHALARNLAAGMRDAEAALITGYDISRISILKADPQFQELMEFYRADVDRAYADLHERLAGLSVDAADELTRRLEDAPEDVSTGQLLEIMKSTADRTGHGPSSKSEQTLNVNVNLATRLEAARRRIAERRTIDLSPE